MLHRLARPCLALAALAAACGQAITDGSRVESRVTPPPIAGTARPRASPPGGLASTPPATPSQSPAATPAPGPAPGLKIMWFKPQPAAPGTVATLAESLAYVWDEATRDSYPLPGAGKAGLRAFPMGDTRFLINRVTGTVDSYDLVTGACTRFNDLDRLGFIVIAVNSADGRTLALLANPDGRRETSPASRAYLWRDGVVASLPKINAAAAAHGGLDYIWLAAAAPLVAFSTLDGRVFLYTLDTGALGEVIEAHRTPGVFKRPAVSPDGAQLVWIGGEPLQTIHLMAVATISTPAGIGYQAVGPPRVLPELAFRNLPPEFLGMAVASPSIYVANFRLDRGEYDLFRLDYDRGRVAVLTTLNLIERASGVGISDLGF